VACQRGLAPKCEWISTTYVEPVLRAVSRAGNEPLLARFDIFQRVLAELDRHLGVCSVGVIPELSQ